MVLMLAIFASNVAREPKRVAHPWSRIRKVNYCTHLHLLFRVFYCIIVILNYLSLLRQKKFKDSVQAWSISPTCLRATFTNVDPKSERLTVKSTVILCFWDLRT
jgi:hypothetical protein